MLGKPKYLTVTEEHIKKLLELSIKPLAENPELEELSFEQQKWINRRMHSSEKSWEAWNQK